MPWRMTVRDNIPFRSTTSTGYVLFGKTGMPTMPKSRTTTEKKKNTTKLSPIHPGEILREEFVRPLGLNANKLAIALRVGAPTIYEIINEERGVTPDMALRLGRYFGTTPEFWL